MPTLAEMLRQGSWSDGSTPDNNQLVNALRGAAETGMTLGTGALAGLAGMPYGVYKGITSGAYGTPEAPRIAAKEAQQFMERNTYQPRTEQGQEYVQKLGRMFEESKLPPVMPEVAALGAIPKQAYAAQAERVGMAAEKALEPAIMRTMERGGKPAQLLEDLTQGSQSQVIAGRNANNFNYFKELEALIMKEKGVSNKEILKDTGIYFGPEGQPRMEFSDVNAIADWSKLPKVSSPKAIYDEYVKTKMYDPSHEIIGGDIEQEAKTHASNVYNKEINQFVELQDILEHPELYQAYPALKKYGVSGLMPTSSERGSFHPEEQRIRIAGNLSPEEKKSTLLHEVQHAIQEIEGFPKGGNPQVSRSLMQESKREETFPLRNSKSLFDNAVDDYGIASKGLYMHKLKELATRQNITPSQVLNMAPWYEYSDVVRERIGAMPKRSGYDQKNWLRNAAQIIYEKEYNSGKFRDVVDFDAKQLESMKRKASRNMDKHQPEAREFSKLESKYKNLENLSDYEIYRRLGGEAESRAVQERMNMPQEQLRQSLPLESYDVPLNELIFRKGAYQ